MMAPHTTEGAAFGLGDPPILDMQGAVWTGAVFSLDPSIT
jgi:hypothetical protein